MVEVKIYTEGGGDAERLLRACRAGFTAFFERAGLKGMMPRVVACGGRGAAMDRFKSQVAIAASDQVHLLLVDSEDPVTGPCSGATAIAFLDARDGKGLGAIAKDHQCHLMVQVMESCFLADPDELARFYGQGFNKSSLPTTSLENVMKQTVYDALNSATKSTKTKGAYSKASHSFELLGQIDAKKVFDKSPWAARLVTTIAELKQGVILTKP